MIILRSGQLWTTLNIDDFSVEIKPTTAPTSQPPKNINKQIDKRKKQKSCSCIRVVLHVTI